MLAGIQSLSFVLLLKKPVLNLLNMEQNSVKKLRIILRYFFYFIIFILHHSNQQASARDHWIFHNNLINTCKVRITTAPKYWYLIVSICHQILFCAVICNWWTIFVIKQVKYSKTKHVDIVVKSRNGQYSNKCYCAWC